MAKLTKEELLKQVEEMSVLELSDLVKALEEKFGVSAAAMAIAPAATAGAAADAGEPKEEQTVFNVVISNGGANKIQVIKEVMNQVNKKTAEEAKAKLVAAGATVELK